MKEYKLVPPQASDEGTGLLYAARPKNLAELLADTVKDCGQQEGVIVTDPCPDCKGSGFQKQKRRIAVKVPAGVDDGNAIKMRGEGETGSRGGSPGSLYVMLAVASHDYFRREGDDVIYELPVNFAEAALGTEVDVPTLYGVSQLKIPSGSQTGRIFRLKDRGIARLHGSGRGDQLVALRVVTPESLNKEQRKLFEELSRSLRPVKRRSADS